MKSKLSDDQKKEKQATLWQANSSTINKMSSEVRTQLRSLVAGEGGTLDFPKSQPPAGHEPSDSEF